MRRGELWWADLGPFRPREQTGRRPVVAAGIAGTAIISASEDGLKEDSVALAFQMRAIPKSALVTRVRALTPDEIAELELATDEALGRETPPE